ncbi:MAG: endonuclease/exonuclease/phosphatase family protein [Alphaproteobacteria bacterium]|nr:endonuclease/exonuclease/phosphatase family protein [Alphaproteobacteria bacterium]
MLRPALLVLLAACGDPAKNLGEIDEDLAVLADEPVLAHFAAAMGDDGATVVDLFDEELAFDRAPDPSQLFVDRNVAHITLPEGTGEQISIMTFNAGLLSRHYLAVFKVEVPNIEERRERMAAEVFGAGKDVVFLQEVWEMDDARALAEAGEAAGYRVWFGDKRKLHRETGLLLAVRESLIGDGELQEAGQYAAQWKTENFPGPNLKRGWLHWSFTLAESGVELHLFDTHLTPFYGEWRTRALQVRELGLEIAALPDDAVVLVGGDFNAGWYYPRDLWTDAEGEEHPGWWRNTTMPALLSYYGGLDDLVNLVVIARDVERGAAIPASTDDSWHETPYGDASLCTVQDTYTATDCNSLYRQSYAATEFPARMDLLWLGDRNRRVRARSRGMSFVEPLAFGTAGTFELSDHYGQEVVIEIL